MVCRRRGAGVGAAPTFLLRDLAGCAIDGCGVLGTRREGASCHIAAVRFRGVRLDAAGGLLRHGAGLRARLRGHGHASFRRTLRGSATKEEYGGPAVESAARMVKKIRILNSGGLHLASGRLGKKNPLRRSGGGLGWVDASSVHLRRMRDVLRSGAWLLQGERIHQPG